ncbi:MAG: thioredoxin family protein [Gemmatimonadales bacterium]|nr:thioredoxin family protein [Gemmatimonadales bacterium]
MPDFKSLWDAAEGFDTFIAPSSNHKALWLGLYRIARLPKWATAAVPPGAHRRLLVIAEDWCGDASNTVPILARFADAVPGFELRILARDQHPELMDRYLTNGSRSIPIVIALDEQFRELGYWGPRPTVLQSWVMANRASIPKTELYPQVRTWYARDRGESTLREVLEMAGYPVAKVA